MKKFKSKQSVAYVLIIFVLLVLSCKMKPELKDCVEKDLCTNPKLKQRKITVFVDSEKDGYITLEVQPNGNPFSQQTMSAIRQGKSLHDIRMFMDSSVDVLIEAEEIVKKRPGVKSVTWTASDSEPGSTTSRGAGCDYFQRQCSE